MKPIEDEFGATEAPSKKLGFTTNGILLLFSVCCLMSIRKERANLLEHLELHQDRGCLALREERRKQTSSYARRAGLAAAGWIGLGAAIVTIAQALPL